jgi:hypothetical protein
LFVTWKWNYAVPFLLSIVGSFLVGILFHYIAPRLTWIAKYIVTFGELALLQWYSQAVTKSLFLVCLFTAPLLLLIVSETASHFGGKESRHFIVRICGSIGDKLFGVERVFKFTLGAYFSFTFGLASMFNEVILLWAMGLIGAVEIEPKSLVQKTVATCKKCLRLRIVFIPDFTVDSNVESEVRE